MRSLIFSGLVGALVAVSGPGWALVVTIDPDDFASGTDVSTAIDGVTLSSVPHASPGTRDPIFATDWSAAYQNVLASPANSTITFGFPAFPDSLDAVFRADFRRPTDFVSLLAVSPSEANSMSVRAFNSSGVLVGFANAPGVTLNQPGIVGDFDLSIVLPSPDISYIIAGGTVPLSPHFIDRLTFNRLPEPGTLPLLAIGIIVVGIWSGRKRRQRTARF